MTSPVAAPQTSSWVQELINKRYQPGEERIKRSPVGFSFSREPFDPSSYYKQLGSYRDISRGATAVVEQEAINRQEAEYARQQAENQKRINDQIKGIDARFTYSNVGGSPGGGGGPKYKLGPGKSRKYGLKGITSNTAKAADYFGSKYGIANIGGYRSKGSVPGSEHPKGRALDYMTSNKAKGTALANDVIQNYKSWNVKYVIWNKHIWQPGRGWHKYNGPSDHTDHVHVSFNK